MTDWFPIVFVTFKLIVLATGMYFAIKWHYDQGKKGKTVRGKGVLLRGTVTALLIFVLALAALGVVTFEVSKMLGLDLG